MAFCEFNRCNELHFLFALCSERENVVVNENVGQCAGDDEVRAPLPVKRDTLYGDASFIR